MNPKSEQIYSNKKKIDDFSMCWPPNRPKLHKHRAQRSQHGDQKASKCHSHFGDFRCSRKVGSMTLFPRFTGTLQEPFLSNMSLPGSILDAVFEPDSITNAILITNRSRNRYQTKTRTNMKHQCTNYVTKHWNINEFAALKSVDYVKSSVLLR